MRLRPNQSLDLKIPHKQRVGSIRRKLSEDEGFTAEYEGKTYHFCSKECADMFQKDPKAMLEKIAEGTVEESGDAMEEQSGPVEP